MTITDLNKPSHKRFSDKYYTKLQRACDLQRDKRLEARAVRQRDMYLGLANDAVAQGKLAHADALRQVACGMLPREWANLTVH